MHFFTHWFATSVLGLAATTTLMFAPPGLAHEKSKNTGIVPPALMQTADVHIGAKGAIALRGAVVTAVSSSTITATTAFGPTTFTWTIDAANARFAGNNNGTLSSTTPVAVGNVINVDGALASSSQPIVEAKLIKDLTVLGTIKGDDDHDGDEHGRGK